VVEDLEQESSGDPLMDADVFEEGDVGEKVRWVVEAVAADVADGPEGGTYEETGLRTVYCERGDGGKELAAVVVGSECSWRTSLALSFLAQMTQSEKACAWIDVSDTLDPESAAAAGVDLSRLLWVRCGVQAVAMAFDAMWRKLAEGFQGLRNY
jgi:recA bacterial DNA recombination protein